MAHGAGLIFDLVAKDGASPTFLRVAAAADKAATSTARAAKGVEGYSAAAAKHGALLTKRLTLPLLAIGAVSVAQAAKWQKSMTLIQTAGGETAAKTAELSKGLKRLAVETGTSLDALGEGIYTVAKAGAQKWSAIDQLKVMKAAAQGAKAENVDLGVATDALSTVMLDYHINASKAVGTENELIRASGLAKTNFAQFSESLSNVTPIAAALGISFDQIGGAIATMTQHGVSAQQATENLRNLLFNLSGQNNVASQAMQQLGINTVDLTKNLGRRGLTGTLAIVDQALRNHTKNGMVVIDVQKAATLATQSLNTMLHNMAGPLREQAQGLLSGRTSIKDYTKYAKDLGGQAGASALQFKALYLNSEGFSNQLRSGKGTITTSTAQYQKLLGGMTGAAVAMQIGGKYAADNARNVKEIGRAALEAGADVLGWNKTQDTFAVKMDKAKASLQVLAVEIGTALIPAVSKIVGWVSKAVHWFDSLSGTQKQILGWSAVFLAALGPILTLGSRLATVGGAIARFATGAGQNLAKFAGASEETATRVGVAMRRAVSAVSGVLAGSVAAQIGGNSSGGWLASIMLGGAGGWALGGPVGAAVGAVSAAIFKGVGLWSDHKKAAQDAAQAEKIWVDSLTQSILSDNGAIGANTRALESQQLSKSGTLDLAGKLGIDRGQVINAALGDTGPFKQNVDASISSLQSQYQKYQGMVDAFQKAHPGRALSRELIDATAGPEKRIQDEIGLLQKLRARILGLAGDTKEAARAERVRNQALNDSLLVQGSYGKQLGALHSKFDVARNDQGALTQSLRAGTIVGDHNRQVLINLVAAAQADADAAGRAAKQHGNWRGALAISQGVFKRHIGEILAAADAAGFNDKQVRTLLTSLGLLNGTHAKPTVDLIDNATATVREISAAISGLHGKELTVWIDYVNRTGVDQPGAQPGNPHSRHTGGGGVPIKAAGGSVADGWFTVGEEGGPRGWELGRKQGSKVDIFSNRDARKLTGWDHVPGFAGGTGGTGGHVTAGNVAPLVGALYSLRDAIAGTAAAARPVLKTVLDDFAKLGFSAREFAKIQKQNGVYVKDLGTVFLATQQRLTGARTLLANTTTYSDSVRQGLTGNFDVSKFGSVADLEGGLLGQKQANNLFTFRLRKLRNRIKGNVPLTKLVGTLAAQGDSATLQTLFGASNRDLATIGSQVHDWNASVQLGADAASQVKYGTTQGQASREVQMLVARQDRLVVVLAQLAAAVGRSATGHTANTERQIESLVNQLEALVRHGRA